MDKRLQKLVKRSRVGGEGSFQKLVRGLRAKRGGAARLATWLRSPEEALRRAALELVRERNEPELITAAAALACDPHSEVRRHLGEILASCPNWPLDDAVIALLNDADEKVRLAAVPAARCRPALQSILARRLAEDNAWSVRHAIAKVLSESTASVVLSVLLAALGEDSDGDVQETCAVAVERCLATGESYPQDVPRPGLTVLRAIHDRLKELRLSRFPYLNDWLNERFRNDVDADYLRSFGTFLSDEVECRRLPRAYGVESICALLDQVLRGAAPRAAVLLGESGAGKTAVLHEFVHRCRRHADGPWHLLRVLPSEFLAGTRYLGEWESKFDNLMQAIRSPRRVLLYIPNLEQLASVGVTCQTNTNVAGYLAPFLERGDVAVIGESTPEAFRGGLGGNASLRRLFQVVYVPPADAEQTRSILQAVRLESPVDVSDAVLERLTELADHYLSNAARPGRTIDLLRRSLAASASHGGPLTTRDVLTTLSTSTGIPVDFLDDNVPLDQAATHAFFTARIMGQPEAVRAAVNRVTLVKAGLCDPAKPFGVLLFIGPTGVGKTELARALAEFLFGNPAHLIRLDMSEFATHDAYERLIGSHAKPGLLTSAVRERPFSVLLLDEIEKAHVNFFDLCLQIFDAGRLTDGQGRTVDFRRTVIILTSNIGSHRAGQAPLGFGIPQQPARAAETTLRELRQWFRPEFLNRIDDIVSFAPLSADTIVGIARREVKRLLERSGLARRRLALNIEPDVFALLARQGYSPAFGARPLKRAIERLLLVPTAEAIAAGNVPPGAVLHLRARADRIVLDVADTHAATSPERQRRGENVVTRSA